MSIRIGMVSTFPPTPCGIATFSQALTQQLRAHGARVGIVRVVPHREPTPATVAHQWVTGPGTGAEAAARVLNAHDVAVIQHEYGIFGGPDGQDVIDLVQRLDVPVVSVLHTVLTEPTTNQHRVLAALCESSAALVTMTATTRDRLIELWGQDPARVSVIPHGAQDNRGLGLEPQLHDRPVVLTWGLLGPGKGIEWAIRALAELQDVRPAPAYHVVGQTHPRVVETHGEAYRDRLFALVDEHALGAQVSFDDRYLSGPALRSIVRDADIILLPYDSRDQVTSGVLTEAVAAGKPVVSTAFPHAVELLSSGAGILVPQRDPSAIASGLRRLLTEPGLAAQMGATSRELATAVLWPTVADQYLQLSSTVLGASAARVVA